MKCLMKYEWVKLMRSHLPQGKGVMGAWMKLASRAAFRKGIATYCGYKNEVSPGMWSGGIVGIKSILGIKKKSDALLMLDKLSELGYIKYELNSENKKLTYQITDWVVKCSGEECMNGTVYTTNGYGFICLPRNITERLVSLNYKFEETDAWLDLWCHTVSNDAGNAFSFSAPVVQYGKYGALLTLENLGKRWNWEKTKVWRFFQKYRDVFTLYKMPVSYGCLVFNKLYPTDTETAIPSHEETVRILEEIRIYGQNTHKQTSDHEHINKLICWYSKNICQSKDDEAQNNRVAESAYILRAYISPCTKEGWFSLRIPALLPKKSEGSAEYVRSFLYPAMKEFFEGLAPVRYTDCILIYRHVYDEKRPERRMRDHDNIEINMVSDIIAMYVMPDDGPEICSHYYCSAKGQTDRTEVYVLPKSEFAVWLTIENSMPDEGVKLYESPVFWKEKHM